MFDLAPNFFFSGAFNYCKPRSKSHEYVCIVNENEANLFALFFIFVIFLVLLNCLFCVHAKRQTQAVISGDFGSRFFIY